jgi:hypothetical protein
MRSISYTAAAPDRAVLPALSLSDRVLDRDRKRTGKGGTLRHLNDPSADLPRIRQGRRSLDAAQLD